MFLLAPVQADDSEIRYFDQPPSAEALADILFPTQYRSIKGDADVPEQPRFSGFGMPIQFEYGSTIIIAPSLPYLDSVGEMLNLDGVEDRKLIIEGHTDSAGSREYNQKLSESRAEAVKLYLMSVFNIDPDRLVTVGRGETELFDRRDPLAAT
ncbi:MAG: OmpA family protein, partial [Arenicellales bacterium]|nr:OmpA family protein [Arenicellales bacterium]